MKFKVIPIIVISIITVTVLCSCAGLFANLGGGKKGGDVVVTWDEGLTSGVTRITNDGTVKGSVKASPDGTKLLYTEHGKGGNYQVMYLRDASNPAKTPLIGEVSYSPTWYADSNQFIYVSYENNAGRLVRSNVSSGGRTYISRAPIGDIGDNHPSIKNGVITFTAFGSSGVPQIATVKENGTESTFLGEGRNPSWHPTQDKLIFIKPRIASNGTTRLPGGDIYEMDIKSGQVTQIYSDTGGICFEPSYSPDGGRILFTKNVVAIGGTRTVSNLFGGSTTESVDTYQRHIFVMNADGTNVSPVSSGNASVNSPSWGKNGEVFCLVGLPGKAFEIYKLRIRN